MSLEWTKKARAQHLQLSLEVPGHALPITQLWEGLFRYRIYLGAIALRAVGYGGLDLPPIYHNTVFTYSSTQVSTLKTKTATQGGGLINQFISLSLIACNKLSARCIDSQLLYEFPYLRKNDTRDHHESRLCRSSNLGSTLVE